MSEPESVPLSRMRRAIAQAMSLSATIPQFSLESDADLTALAAFRSAQTSAGRSVSYSDVFVAACARALREHPQLNASFRETEIFHPAVVNVGLAVALDDGLVAPAFRNADTLTLTELAAERVRLTAAAREGKLTPEYVLSATFTISNLGPFGIRRFRPLVVPPQAAILGIGALMPDSLLSLCLSVDHRVTDGAPAAAFLADVIARLESPAWLEAIL